MTIQHPPWTLVPELPGVRSESGLPGLYILSSSAQGAAQVVPGETVVYGDSGDLEATEGTGNGPAYQGNAPGRSGRAGRGRGGSPGASGSRGAPPSGPGGALAIGSEGPKPTYTVGIPWQSPRSPDVWRVRVRVPVGTFLDFEAGPGVRIPVLLPYSEPCHTPKEQILRATRLATDAINAARS